MMIEQLRTILCEVEEMQAGLAMAQAIGLGALEDDDAQHHEEIAAALEQIDDSLEAMFAAIDPEES